MTVYYNENDDFAASWLKSLISKGLIAPGDVDNRSIEDVAADDLKGYNQCHFFAGIGGWSYALRLAGWPDEKPVWTGSCPCQPFSQSGSGNAFDDDRHLFPVWQRLIEVCAPSIVFGEQSASPLGRSWFSGVRSEMESLGYAVGGADLCAAGVGSAHIRQRLYFVAVADADGWDESNGQLQRGGQYGQRAQNDCTSDGARCAVGAGQAEGHCRSSVVEGFDGWRGADRLHCWDGAWRPVEPGSFPLVNGVSDRLAQQRAYGNAIDPRLAAKFIDASVLAWSQ
ncbi:DNA cytosine methyltransferase [Loktanella sp. 3ANDIMAR09]|uniref:DNA cytosine methyltransferase n=1 Tax=Loktanella sp. 3ANDIMAR09 TaxID=1225657 RepID=UPI0009F898EE|nr:DNA cytosine methyltransferase [Loktanella sp. 3ANDIMAR09]